VRIPKLSESPVINQTDQSINFQRNITKSSLNRFELL